MKSKQVWRAIEAAIGSSFIIEKRVRLAGGSINSAFRIEGGNRAFFVKLNRAELRDMFAAEFEGLLEMATTETVRVPEPIACGADAETAFLILESLNLNSSNTGSEHILGAQLAAMHNKAQSGFGWIRDNTIGSTLQKNPSSQDWIAFWRDQRLGFQLQLAEKNGAGSALLDCGLRLCEGFHALFESYTPSPALLHGDLWAGNAAADGTGQPVIFDPACYYGDRECDIAMTELFGGFGTAFYRAYNATWPMDAGYRVRKTLYNLYHVLNHFNLFGGGYQRQAETMIRTLLAEFA